MNKRGHGVSNKKKIDSGLRDKINIDAYVESITGNGIVNHENFTCNSDLSCLVQPRPFF